MSSDWTGGHSGNWAVASNWQAASVPGAADDAVVQGNASSSYTIYVTNAEAAASLLLDDPAATLQVAAAGDLGIAGTIAPLAGTLVLAGTLAGGTLAGTGQLVAAGGTLVGVAVAGTVTLAAANRAQLPVPPLATLSASGLSLLAGATLAVDDVDLVLLGDAVSTGGTLGLGTANDGTELITLVGHTLTLDAATSLAVGAGGAILGGTLINQGSISAHGLSGLSAGQLTIAGDTFLQAGTVTLVHESLTIASAAFTNTGTMSLTNAALTLAAADVAANTGVMALGNAAALTVASSLSGTGTVLLQAGGTAELHGFAGTVQFAPGSGGLQLDAAQGFAGTITGFDGTERLTLEGLQATPVAASWSAGLLTITELDGSSFGIAVPGTFAAQAFQLAPAQESTGGYDVTLVAANCFARGTRIRTRRGEVPVEQLDAQDAVWSPLARAWRPVLWIGRRRLDARRHPEPDTVRPVRIPAGALGRGLPANDLVLSPDHALFVRASPDDAATGALVPARLLLGHGAAQEPAGPVEYFHVEVAAGGTPAHDVLLAEGVAAETWLDDGGRAGFANGAAHLILHPELARRGPARPVLPYAVSGWAVAALQARATRPRAGAAALGAMAL